MSTDAEKLAQIAALDTFDVSVWGEPGSPFANGAAAVLSRVHAILAEPGPAVPAHDIDLRDALTAEVWMFARLIESGQWANSTIERTVGRILALVRPVEGVVLTPEEADLVALPPTTIDRDALYRMVKDLMDGGEYDHGPVFVNAAADRILELVQPAAAEGIVLTREEARDVLGWLRIAKGDGYFPGPKGQALAARLEASS